MKYLSAVFAAVFAFIPLHAAEPGNKAPAAARPLLDRYELSILYDATGYFTLSVFEKNPDGSEVETVYGLRKAENYSSKSPKSESWMVFFGEQPPAYEKHTATKVLKDLWLLYVKDGDWYAARVKHNTGKHDIYQILRVQSAKDGSPELVYLSGDGDEDSKSVDGWADDSKMVVKPENLVRIKNIRFISLPPSQKPVAQL